MDKPIILPILFKTVKNGILFRYRYLHTYQISTRGLLANKTMNHKTMSKKLQLDASATVLEVALVKYDT